MAAAFPLLGEPLALELANTVVQTRGREVDLLAEPGAVTAWLAAQAARLPAGAPPTAGEVVALRDALRVLFAALAARRPAVDEAVETVNRAATLAAGRLEAAPAGARLAWSSPRRPGGGILAALSQSALAVVAAEIEVRACENPECLLHFAATDPRRRFCSTRSCANRARQARHRARNA